MDHRARQVLEALSRSHYLGLTSSSLNCILETADPRPGRAAASSLDIAQYLSPAQSDQLDAPPDEAHVDRGLLTLIWSDSTSGLQVYLQKTCHVYICMQFMIDNAQHMLSYEISSRLPNHMEDSLKM